MRTDALPEGKVPVELLARVLDPLAPGPPEVRLGPRVGEDAAAIDVRAGTLVVATDPITLTSGDLGRFSVTVNANDVAVTGARPRWFCPVVLLPPGSTETEVEALFEGPGLVAPTLVTVASFSILFREGIEVILVLAAILGYIQTQNPQLRRPLWWGAGLAIPASLLTWFILNWVLHVAPIGREVIEALVSLLAVALMFYISFWLLRRLDVRRWMEFLRARVWDAVAAGNTGAVAALGFVSVYREGAETALFYQALLLIAQRLELWILLGIGLAILALSVIGWAIIALGARLPLRAFLGIAVAVIMLLSVGLLGNAVWELQQIGVVPMTLLGDSFPRFNRFLADLLGLHATLETVAAQSLLLLVYLAAWLYAFWWQPRGAGSWRRQGTGAG